MKSSEQMLQAGNWTAPVNTGWRYWDSSWQVPTVCMLRWPFSSECHVSCAECKLYVHLTGRGKSFLSVISTCNLTAVKPQLCYFFCMNFAMLHAMTMCAPHSIGIKVLFLKDFSLLSPFLKWNHDFVANNCDKSVIFIKKFSDKHSFLIINIESMGPRICVLIWKCQLHPVFICLLKPVGALQSWEKHFLSISSGASNLSAALQASLSNANLNP